MSKDPEGQANKTSENISSKPDDLVQGELTDNELDAVTGGNIQAVSYSALNAAATSAQSDLQNIMGDVQLINNEKTSLRNTVNVVNKHS